MLATPRRRVAAAVVLLLLLALIAFFVFRAFQPKPGAAAQGTASLTLFIGTAQVTKSGSTTAATAHTGDQVTAGDTVETGDSSKAAINYPDGSVTRIDPAKNRVLGSIQIGGAPGGIAAAGGSVWVTTTDGDSIVRIDPQANQVTGSAPGGSGVACVGLTAKNVWVADTDDGTVTRLGG